jgi:hypothetical protein
MKTALVLLLSFGSAVMAADNEKEPKAPATKAAAEQSSGQVKKLGSVTWDLASHKLVWVVQNGTMQDGEFVPGTQVRYEISPDEAVMAASGQLRGFDDQEAVWLRRLLDVLSLYCAESVAWWDEGQGTPVGPGEKPSGKPGRRTTPDQPNGKKPVRVNEPQPGAPVYHIPEGALVAALQGIR